MSINLKNGFNNNLITNTKFLGLTMDCTLSCNNHIDKLMKKLSTACYIIRTVKTHISNLAVKINYHTFFTCLCVTELYSRETRHIVPQFLACRKRQLELWKEAGIEFHVEIYLRN